MQAAAADTRMISDWNMLPTDLIEVVVTDIFRTGLQSLLYVIVCDWVNLSTPAGLTAQQIILIVISYITNKEYYIIKYKE